MRRSILEYLRCFDCSQSQWDVGVDCENKQEIRDAKLTCLACQREYSVKDGILDMIGEDLAPEIVREKEHAESHGYLETEDGKQYPINRETINRFKNIFLSLPAGDGSRLFQPGGSFDNQAGNAQRFFKTLDLLKLTGRERVLEVGASFGWASWRFAGRGCDVVAVDISEYTAAADLYFEADGSYFERMMADMNQLPFQDNTFDIIFSHSVIHHCQDLGKLFKEFKRLLRPGGRVVALHECAFGLLEDKSGKALQEAIEEGFNENAYTIPQWTGGAHKGGFRNVKCHYFSFIDDYIDRKTFRKAPETSKLRAAKWIQSHPHLHSAINQLSILPRIILRPKNWMIIATK